MCATLAAQNASSCLALSADARSSAVSTRTSHHPRARRQKGHDSCPGTSRFSPMKLPGAREAITVPSTGSQTSRQPVIMKSRPEGRSPAPHSSSSGTSSRIFMSKSSLARVSVFSPERSGQNTSRPFRAGSVRYSPRENTRSLISEIRSAGSPSHILGKRATGLWRWREKKRRHFWRSCLEMPASTMKRDVRSSSSEIFADRPCSSLISCVEFPTIYENSDAPIIILIISEMTSYCVNGLKSP
mmetsp:Transcript_13372/g.32677  ORF Transcript_13372/g.32677 Transcript_13372/m.32677 type:complete len:243 (-) Transcript_13372:652-1380(-)